jgi:hypothetical protein
MLAGPKWWQPILLRKLHRSYHKCGETGASLTGSLSLITSLASMVPLWHRRFLPLEVSESPNWSKHWEDRANFTYTCFLYHKLCLSCTNLLLLNLDLALIIYLSFIFFPFLFSPEWDTWRQRKGDWEVWVVSMNTELLCKHLCFLLKVFNKKTMLGLTTDHFASLFLSCNECHFN